MEAQSLEVGGLSRQWPAGERTPGIGIPYQLGWGSDWDVKEGTWETDHWLLLVAVPGPPGPASLGVGCGSHSAGAFPLVPSPGLTKLSQA